MQLMSKGVHFRPGNRAEVGVFFFLSSYQKEGTAVSPGRQNGTGFPSGGAYAAAVCAADRRKIHNIPLAYGAVFAYDKIELT